MRVSSTSALDQVLHQAHCEPSFTFDLLNVYHAPSKEEINTNITEGTQSGHLDPAATPPAEASGVGGTTPTVKKERGAVFMRGRVGLVRSGRGAARRKRKVVETVQNEASPAALCCETPESKDFLFTECQGMFWRHSRLFCFFLLAMIERPWDPIKRGSLPARLGAHKRMDFRRPYRSFHPF